MGVNKKTGLPKKVENSCFQYDKKFIIIGVARQGSVGRGRIRRMKKVTPPSCSKAGSFERIYSTSPENHFPAL
jgi:hypothetical protein